MRFERAFRPTRALGAAWQAALLAPGSLLGGGALLVACELALAGSAWTVLAGRATLGAELGAELNPELGMWLALLGSCCASLVVAPLALLARAAVLAGHARAVERVAIHGEERLADLAAARALRGRLPAVLVAGAALSVWRLLVLAPPVLLLLAGPRPALLVALALSAAALWTGLRYSLAPYAVVFEELGLRAALARSRALSAGHRLGLLRYEAALLAAAGLGLGLCCVGVLFSGALAEVARSESYLRVVRRAPWWLDGDA